ncbi:MAG: UvrD-helicase domain-containing protein, partial [Enterobacteriaceae bacterium]
RALHEIRYSVQQQKRQRAELGFDDLLSRLDSALASEGGEALAQLIRQRYPLAMIDEFQDTDPQQYRIFRTLYFAREECGLLLIGDPKQAIYAFRGADIFTYLQARQQITAHYTLKTNWRSSPAMVQAVNCLFSRPDQPFVVSQIPFKPVEAADHNQTLIFEYQGQPVRPLRFWLQPGQGVGITEYQLVMGQQCAAQIRDWLQAGQQGEAWLHRAGERKPLQAADITVLVRNRNEAAIIADALAALAIPSVYLSNRDSVFAMPEAQDLLWLMQAVLSPEQERLLRTALASRLFGLDANTLYQLNQDQKAWEARVAEFAAYRKHWQSRGILPMLREVLARRQLAENILAMPGGERRITDLLHLGELLQEASLTLESEHALVRWLAQQITAPDGAGENQQLRLESDRHLVQIVTVHKSKGLDYPIVCLPFICGFRRQRQALYHDPGNFQAILDLTYGEEGVQLAEKERLAEDLRLLYVALTRSVYHCSLGVAPLIGGTRKKQGMTDLHHGALGYLLQQGQSGDATLLAQHLAELAA